MRGISLPRNHDNDNYYDDDDDYDDYDDDDYHDDFAHDNDYDDVPAGRLPEMDFLLQSGHRDLPMR